MAWIGLALIAWAVVSIPAALAAGALLERIGADGEPRTVDHLLRFPEEGRP